MRAGRTLQAYAQRHSEAFEAPESDSRLAVAKAAFRPPTQSPAFRHSRLDDALKPLCETRLKLAPVAPGLAGKSDHDLIVRLCEMPAGLASALLRSSLPALDTRALLTLLDRTGAQHHALIASRPGIDWRVVKAILCAGHAPALLALAANLTIDLDGEDQTYLAEAAEDDPILRAAVLGRPGLRLAHALIQPAPDHISHSNLKLIKLARTGDRSAFAREAARRLKTDGDRLASTLATESAVPFALACCALGLDRAVFLSLLSLWQKETPAPPQRALLASIFAMTPQAACNRLMALAV